MPPNLSHPLSIAVVAVMALAASACGTSSSDRNAAPGAAGATAVVAAPTSGATQEPAKNTIARSAEKFRLATSYRLHYTIAEPILEGSIEGEAAYRSGEVLFALTSFFAAAPGAQVSDSLKAYLFLPPDLYLEHGDGSWFVQSPWNQGIKPSKQKPEIGLQEPIVDYADLAHHLRDAETTGDNNDLNTKPSRHFRARVELHDVAALSGSGASGSADVDLWIAPDSDLPQRVQLTSSGRDEFLVTIEFTDFDQPILRPAPPQDARPYRDVQFPDAPCTGNELANCLHAQSQIHGASSCAGAGRRVCFVPLGMIAPDLIDHLVSNYRDQYGLTVTVLAPAAIPPNFEEPKRQQIDAAQLIDYMGILFPADYRDPDVVLIGITPVDLYNSNNHFRYLFGLKGSVDDPKAVMSPLRMNPQFYSEAADGPLYYSRARKLVSKYIGFLYYRLPLSSAPTSPLYDSIGGPSDVDRMTEPLPVPHS